MAWYDSILGSKNHVGKRRGRYEIPEEARLEKVRKRLEEAAPLDGEDLLRQLGPAPEGPLLGLRVDIRTSRGLRNLPALLEVLQRHGARATLAFGLGPERPFLGARAFLAEPPLALRALRQGLHRFYGWEGLLKGLLWPGRPLAARAREGVRAARQAGHELAALPWDHWRWQRSVRHLDADRLAAELLRGAEALSEAAGGEVRIFASPGWLCSEESLRQEARLSPLFGSDCRGSDPFLPVLEGRVLRIPEVPVTLPTAWELMLAEGLGPGGAFARLAAEARGGAWPVYGASAELEGGAFLPAFGDFLRALGEEGRKVVPLGSLLAARLRAGGPLPRCTMAYGALDGRPGFVSLQLLEV
ncbi:MAG: hypothetical protein ACP5VN_09010 [Acidobacteriota bacterium]